MKTLDQLVRYPVVVARFRHDDNVTLPGKSMASSISDRRFTPKGSAQSRHQVDFIPSLQMLMVTFYPPSGDIGISLTPVSRVTSMVMPPPVLPPIEDERINKTSK